MELDYYWNDMVRSCDADHDGKLSMAEFVDFTLLDDDVRAVPCRAVPCRAVPCRAVPCRAVPCCAVLC